MFSPYTPKEEKMRRDVIKIIEENELTRFNASMLLSCMSSELDTGKIKCVLRLDKWYIPVSIASVTLGIMIGSILTQLK